MSSRRTISARSGQKNLALGAISTAQATTEERGPVFNSRSRLNPNSDGYFLLNNFEILLTDPENQLFYFILSIYLIESRPCSDTLFSEIDNEESIVF